MSRVSKLVSKYLALPGCGAAHVLPPVPAGSPGPSGAEDRRQHRPQASRGAEAGAGRKTVSADTEVSEHGGARSRMLYPQ